MYICICQALRENHVESAARACLDAGAGELEDLVAALDLYNPDFCGWCLDHVDILQDILDQEEFGIPRTRRS